MISIVILLLAVSAEADFFQFDSISNVSTYYFNYIYCNIWEGDCLPNQEDATQQGKIKCLNIRSLINNNAMLKNSKYFIRVK